MALRHEEFEECRCCDRARETVDLYKREILAASATVKISGHEIFVHPMVKVEIDGLRMAATDALARLEKGAPGWGAAKDVLRASLQPSQ